MLLRLVNLPIRLQRRWLVGATVTAGLGVLVAVLISVLPLGLPVGEPDAVIAAPTSAPAPLQTPPLESYAGIWQRDLQQPLYDAPPAAPPPPPKLNVTLLGTAVDPGFTYGIFQTAAGESKLVSVGQSIEGATVTAVSADSAMLRVGDREFLLNVVRKEAN